MPHTPFPWVGMLALAGAVFVSVTSELLPTGLLPQMAESLAVSQSSIGMLVAIFATMVVISAVALTGLTQRFDRKRLILCVLAVFAIANFLVALAPNYETVVVARLLGGLAQGLFWAVVGAYPGHLLPARSLARGVAITSAGGSAAFVLGVPAGTALGHAIGWRAAFAVVGIIVIVLALTALKYLPAVQHRATPKPDADAIDEPPRTRPRSPDAIVITLVFVTVFTLMTGHNILYTYIVPFFTDINGFAPDWVSGLLLINGLAGVIGLALVATVWAKHPRTGLIGSIALIIIAISLLGAAPHEWMWVIIALAVWGIAMSAPPALLQTAMLKTLTPRLRDIGAAIMTTGFNLGIATGALLGSGLLDTIGLETLPFAAATAITLCLLIVALGSRNLHRATQPQTSSAPAER